MFTHAPPLVWTDPIVSTVNTGNHLAGDAPFRPLRNLTTIFLRPSGVLAHLAELPIDTRGGWGVVTSCSGLASPRPVVRSPAVAGGLPFLLQGGVMP